MEFVVWGRDSAGRQDAWGSRGRENARRASGVGPEEIGLSLADDKTVLKQIQERVVQIR